MPSDVFCITMGLLLMVPVDIVPVVVDIVPEGVVVVVDEPLVEVCARAGTVASTPSESVAAIRGSVFILAPVSFSKLKQRTSFTAVTMCADVKENSAPEIGRAHV